MNLKSTANLIVNEYNARKAQAEAKYREALTEHAELYAADKAVRCAMLDGKSKDVPQLIEQRNKIINSLGYSAEDFFPLPICDKCKDTGYANGKFCECTRRRAVNENVEFSAPPFSFDECDLSIFEEEAKITTKVAYDKAKIYCQKFPNTKSINMLLMGTAGTGKTYLAACIANELEQCGYSCTFLTAFKFNDICKKYHYSFDGSHVDELTTLLDTDLLIIDDLGSESNIKNITQEYLYTVVNERMDAEKHTIITTNLSPLQLEARYSERTASRLFAKSACLTILMQGKDLRR